MVKSDERIVMKAIALCFKPYLKPEEAMIYCNLGRTQLSKKLDEYGIFKNSNGYIKKDELDKMLQGLPSPDLHQANQLKLKFHKR